MPPHTIAAAADALRRGVATAASLVEASLEAIERLNPTTNAFIRVDADGARRAARAADDERARGIERGPLHGVPISLKDLIDVAGQPTTAGSRVLLDRVAARDAPIVTRLREAGAVIVGKTNLHEFALGTTSEDSAFGPVRHPQDRTRSAGGSSGGAGVAVATGMGLGAVGTDTGGSVRIPAAACGIVGLKPAAGDIPTQGVVPLSWSLDHVGPLARTAQDAGWLWGAMAAQPLALLQPPDLATLRLCRLGGYFAASDADVRAAFDAALDALRRRGARLGERSLGQTGTIATAYVHMVLPEAATWHAAMLDARSADYTVPVRSRLEGGRLISAVDYLQARAARRALRASVDHLLSACDALVLPTLPIVAPPLGADAVVLDGPSGAERLSVRTAMLRQTQPFNLTGHPAISLPLSTLGLPVGLQLVGPRDQTARLLAIAAAVEQVVSPSVPAE